MGKRKGCKNSGALVIMMKALFVAEGTARRIYPELEVVSEAKAHISKLAAKR